MSKIIVRGYIIPYVEGDRIKHTERLPLGEEYLNTFINIFKDVLVSIKGFKLNDAKSLNFFLNLFTIYIKMLLYIDPIKDDEKVIIPSPITYLYKYYIDRYFKKEYYKPLYDKDGLKNYVEKFIDEISKGSDILKRKYNMLELLKIPADTRPSANTSSLLLHSLVTSAIASSIYMEKNKSKIDDKELAFIRVLSLFHDIGKFAQWREHEKKSSEVLQEIQNIMLSEGYTRTDSDVYNIIKNVIELLKGEKEIEDERLKELYENFRRADELSSGFDRIMKFLPLALSEKTKNMLLGKINEFFKRSYKKVEEALENKEVITNWIFWNEHLTIEEIEKITEEFCMNSSRISYENEVLRELTSKSVTHMKIEPIEFILLDIKSIQKYIKCNDLRSIMGGSRIVDLIIYASLPDLIISSDHPLPYECIITFGGGNLTIIAPSGFSNILEEELSKINIDGVKVNIGSSPYYEDYISVNNEIEKNLMLNKTYCLLKESPKDIISIESIFRKCDFCGEDVAKKIVKENYICDKCHFKYTIGELEYFKYRIYSYGKLEYIKLLKEGDIMVFLAGHTLDESRKSKEIREYKNLSIIKFDGNIIGQFMSSALSITDILERSIRVDYAVKYAINKFYQILKNISGNDFDIPLQFILGYMYCGGDDGAFILPSNIAIPFALHILNTYYLEMGGKSTLSLSIIGANPKHPVISLYEASNKLLDYAKNNNGRDLCYNKIHSISLDKVTDEFRGAIAFYNVDTGRISEEYLPDILRTLYDDRVSIQEKFAYTLSNVNQEYSIMKLIRLIFPNENLDLNNLDNLVRTMLEKVIKDKEFNDKLKDIRNIIHKTLSISLVGESDIKLKISYVLAKGKEDFNIPMMLNSLLLIEKGNFILKLLDLNFIIKLLGSGII